MSSSTQGHRGNHQQINLPTSSLLRKPCQWTMQCIQGSQVCPKTMARATSLEHQCCISHCPWNRSLLHNETLAVGTLLCMAEEYMIGAVPTITAVILHFEWHSLIDQQHFLLLVITGKICELGIWLHMEVIMEIQGSAWDQDLGDKKEKLGLVWALGYGGWDWWLS